MAESGAACIDFGIATRALRGESISGDLHYVECYPGGIMVAVADGLGHGEDAADASQKCIEQLKGRGGQPLPELVERCHEAIRHTRGAVLSLVNFSDATGLMTWLGVGNVEGIFIRCSSNSRPATGSLPLRGGVVGARLPKLVPTTLAVQRGDVLILATDGIHPGFIDRPLLTGSVQVIADRILEKHGRDHDDALVIVARYKGPVV